jgi:hypothetical protein
MLYPFHSSYFFILDVYFSISHRVFVLETGDKAEIGALIASYCPSLANWIREAEAPLRKVETQPFDNILILTFCS